MARVSGVTSLVMEAAMRRHVAAIVVGFALVDLARMARADATCADWVGTDDMNHDGMTGQLKIGQTNADCVSLAWCALSLSYAASVKVSSPVLGVIILFIALAFFSLYLVYVYPISEIF
jgi:hypothetical protein